MPPLIDLTGRTFGRLTVFARAENDKNGLSRWCCICSCGNSVDVRGQDLRRGRQVSCGCWKDEHTSLRDYKHGKAGTRLYRIWKNIKSRCYNPNVLSYKDYGARGITMCPDWLCSFQAFYTWALANGYADDLTIDRINVDGRYSPDNCRWVTRAEQNRNTRKTKQKEAEAHAN